MNRLNANDDVMGFLSPSQVAPAAVPLRPAGRRRVAYHEAGHALAGILLGRTFEYVTIEPDEVSLGRCVFGPLDVVSLSSFGVDHETSRSRRARVGFISIWVSIRLAGIASEHIVREDMLWERPSGPICDTTTASELAKEAVGLLSRPIEPRGRSAVFSKLELSAEVEQYLLRKLEETRLLLALNREALDALAEALLERTCLSYRQTRAIAAAHRADLDLEPWLYLNVRRNAASWNELNKEVDRLNREIEIKDLDQKLLRLQNRNAALRRRLGIAPEVDLERLLREAKHEEQELEEELRRRDGTTTSGPGGSSSW